VKPHRLDAGLRWRVAAATALAVGGLVLTPSSHDALALVAADAPAARQPAAPVRVVVQSTPTGLGSAAAAAERFGRVVGVQHTLGTLVAEVPTTAVAALRTEPGVAQVTPDMSVALQSGVGPTGAAGDMTNVARLTGATTFWQNGWSGQGVDVALLDSGVLPIEGLSSPNKLVIGPDLSFESQLDNMRSLDAFGHGTHMAGIIAGRDAGTSPSTYATDNTHFLGMAPGSRIVSLKLADAQGNTDVSQVIAAIDWVVAHATDPGMNIRVLNLSFGTDSSQDYRLDPLAHAAEVAWSRGIVVVVSAGNGDGSTTGLANPAYDPAVLAVGAVNTQGTLDRSDDAVPGFSKKGSSLEGKRGPDLVAPGSSIVSLRAPGSFVDLVHGDTGAMGTRFFKGSGTSQSAAVVSGAAALLLSQRPYLSPDQVRDVLRRSAQDVPGAGSDAEGAGSLDLTAAYATGSRAVAAARVHAGGGSLDKARGTKKVKKNGVVLAGEQDIFGTPTDTSGLATTEALGLDSTPSWTDGRWLGPVAQGATWAGATWAGATWAGRSWSGATWAGATWAGATWAGATWAADGWAGATWAGATWADAQWADDLWSSASWR
jgi:serine protease AprX